MKKILFTVAMATATGAICITNFGGSARGQNKFNAYALNDTIPKKDTTKKDTHLFVYNALDTIPKKDTVKRDTTAFALLAKN